MRIIKNLRIILLLILLILLFLGIKTEVKAAYASIVCNSTTEVNKSVNISVSGSGVQWNLKLIVNGKVVAQSSELDNYLSNKSINFSYNYKPTSTGDVNVKLEGTVTEFSDGSTIRSFPSKKISVKPASSSTSNGSNSSGNSSKPSGGGNSSYNSGGSTSRPNNNTTPIEKEKSKDSTLNALTVKEGTITPEFNKDVKGYSLTIPYETSEVNVTATPTDSKATVAVEGNKNLKEGENTVTVKVTAEDGSASNYVIKVTRKRVPVALKSLMIKYENQEGELIELPLNPAFNFDKLEYTLEDLEYWVEKLSIEAIPNIEGATVDIQGADNLQTGENTITITVKIKAEDAKDVKEGEEPKEETIIYTIKVNKKEEPTLMAKTSNWFNDAWNNVSLWFNQNTEKLILGALGVCVVALIGLSVYIIVDHNRYKDVIAKAKMERKANKSNEENVSGNIIEEIHKDTNDTKKDNIDSDKNDKQKGGKHF